MREGKCRGAACHAVVIVLGGSLGACSPTARPDDEAVSAYLERHGISAPDAAPGTQGEIGPEAPAARRVALTVARATGLPDLDSGPGETDPYVVLEYEGQRHRTSVVEGELEPVWGDTFIIDVRPGGVLMVKLMDEDSLSSDEQLGTVSELLPDLKVGETKEISLSFRNGAGGTLSLEVTGMVRP